MTDHQHNHIHDDGIEYHDPSELDFTPLQLGALSHLNAIVFGVYNIGVEPDDNSKAAIVDQNTGRTVPFTLNKDGSISAFGEDELPGVVFGFSCIAHPGLEEGEASQPFHSLMDVLFSTFADSGDMDIPTVITAGRLIAKTCGLIPEGVPADPHNP